MREDAWELPSRFIDKLLGVGHTIYDEKKVHSDIGFVNNIYLMGFIGTICEYLFWFKHLFINAYKKNKSLKYLYFGLSISLVICEAKGITNFCNPGIAILILFVFALQLESSSILSNKYLRFMQNRIEVVYYDVFDSNSSLSG